MRAGSWDCEGVCALGKGRMCLIRGRDGQPGMNEWTEAECRQAGRVGRVYMGATERPVRECGRGQRQQEGECTHARKGTRPSTVAREAA